MGVERLRQKEFPACTLCLVLTALGCHLGVLLGNVHFARSLNSVGDSTQGWSRVGIGLSRSLDEQLDIEMSKVSSQLLEVLKVIPQAQQLLDGALTLAGAAAEAALAKGKAAKQKALETLSDAVEDVSETAAAIQEKAADTKEALQQTAEAAVAKATNVSQALVEQASPSAIAEKVTSAITVLTDLISEVLHELFDKLKPALYQIGEWVISFGDKIQAALDSFSVTLDKVQKIFDQVMQQLTAKGGGKATMMNETFNLFDVSGTGTISTKDLQDVSNLYSISALAGDKAADLVEKYDSDGMGTVDRKEFSLLVDDPSIPNSMSIVLRVYAKRLSEVAGNIRKARMRDEVALELVNYLGLVCAKNQTKVGWVSDALGNGSLPEEFTASVYAQLCLQEESPNKLTLGSVGEQLMGVMYDMHPQHTLECVDLMSDADFWIENGFDPNDQPYCMSMVTGWLTEAQRQRNNRPGIVSASLFSQNAEDDEEVLKAMPQMAETIALQTIRQAAAKRRQAREHVHSRLYASRIGQRLLVRVLSGEPAQVGAAAQAAINKGQPAKPETLQFATWLSNNATTNANRFQENCADYSGSSSSTLDTFATQIQAMVKKIIGFIDLMEQYSTPKAIDNLEATIVGAADTALEQISKAVQDEVNELAEDVSGAFIQTGQDPGAHIKIRADVAATARAVTSKLQEDIAKVVGKRLAEAKAQKAAKLQHGVKVATELLGDEVGQILAKIGSGEVSRADLPQAIDNLTLTLAGDATADNFRGGHSELLEQHRLLQNDSSAENTLEQVSTLLNQLFDVLPQVTDLLKTARKEVSGLGEKMKSIFSNFEVQGPAIFDNASWLWKLAWVLYFCLFAPLTLIMLFYAFWAGGYFGGPQPVEDEDKDAPPPATFCERLCCCCRSCCSCCTYLHDTQSCFWSLVIILQIVVLLIFIIGIVMSLVFGVQALINAGCAQVYILAEPTICTETITNLRSFQSSFYVSDPGRPLDLVCRANKLMTCGLIEDEMFRGTLAATALGFIGSIVTYQMIIQSAILHEMARYRRMANAALKQQEEL